jgi:hypothetical protein
MVQMVHGRSEVKDDERLGCPSTSKNEENVEKSVKLFGKIDI